jgi:uncharacterized protein (DUF983 family)
MVDGFQPRVLICSECGEEFVFTVKAQQYFVERGYTDDPKRCKACYTQIKKSQRSSKPVAVTVSSDEADY